MSFLIKHDFDQLINVDDMNILSGTDDRILNDSINATQIEVESYIRDRYDVNAMFFDVKQYSTEQTFNVGDKVVLTADNFDTTKQYIVGDLVFNKLDGGIYKCIKNTTNEFPSDPAFFELIGDFGATYDVIQSNTGQNPNDTLFFELTSNRDALLIRMFVDLVLYDIHSRINPRNIPEFRIARRDDVVSYLKMIADPRNNISPGFPLIDHGTDRGVDISFGRTDDTKNAY